MQFGKVTQKEKKVRLIGKPLEKLNNDIHERDNNTCIIEGCDCHVLHDSKFHHEPCGNAKEDRIERGCSLCEHHHTIRHHGKEKLKDIRRQCVEYLSSLYPDDWKEIKDRYIDND